MKYKLMQGRWMQIHGWALQLFALMRSDRLLWTKGLHKRVEGMLHCCQYRAHLALSRAAIHHQR